MTPTETILLERLTDLVTSLESLIDNTLQAFDNDVTLQGMAVGGVNPAILDPPGPVSNGTVTYVTFYITLKMKQLVPAAVKLN